MLIAFIQQGAAKEIGPVSHGEHHHPAVLFAIVVNIAQAARRRRGQRQAVSEGRAVEIGCDLPRRLRFKRDDKVLIAVHETRLLFQDYQRLGNAAGEKGIGVVELAPKAGRAALLIEDQRCAGLQVLAGGLVVFVLLANRQRGQSRN